MLAVSICFGHNYLWNASYPGNVTESKGGGGGGVGREGNPDWQGISYQRNSNKLPQQYETVSQAQFTLCFDNYKRKKGNKVLVTVKSFSPVYLSILISSRVLILIGESR